MKGTCKPFLSRRSAQSAITPFGSASIIAKLVPCRANSSPRTRTEVLLPYASFRVCKRNYWHMICSYPHANAYHRHRLWISYLYHIHLFFQIMFDLQAAHTSTKVLGRWKSQKGEKQPLSRQAKEKTTREVVVFLFLYLNDLYSYFSAAFSDTKSNFFPGKVPVNCKRRLSLGTIADLLRTFQLKSNLYPGWTRKRQR